MSEWYEEIVVKKLSGTVYRITNPTKEHMFLVVGENRAALIDSGGGYGDLWGAIRAVTGLPVILINTHVHPDHVGGNGFFREAWISADDRGLIRHSVSWEARKGFMEMTRPDHAGEFDRIPHVDLPENFIWHDLAGGESFDLGGISLRVVKTPGHTRGSVCFLHEQERTLFVGDLMGRRTTLLARGGAAVAEFLATLRDLQEMLPELAHLYNSHNEGEIPPEGVWNLLSLCVDVLNGEDERIPTDFQGRPGYLAKKMRNRLEREDGKFGNLAYDEACLLPGR